MVCVVLFIINPLAAIIVLGASHVALMWRREVVFMIVFDLLSIQGEFGHDLIILGGVDG
jgi:hypothetical protein